MTINELRANLDLEPIEGGDEHQRPIFDFGLYEESQKKSQKKNQKDFIHH